MNDFNSDLDLGATVRGFTAGQKLFRRYKLERMLGRGGMGVVWLAQDEHLGRPLALKFLPEYVVIDREAGADLKRETNRCLELTHPNIVRIHDYVEDGSCAAISMEFIDGPTLSALKVEQPGGCFDAEQIERWLKQAAEALHYAHTQARVVHRDLKPANLMINSAGIAKVADFGVARSLAESVSRLSMRPSGGGTMSYMSPQQMDGYGPTVADDVYSLGAMIYDLLTSKPPFFRGDVWRQAHDLIPPTMSERREELGVTGKAPIPPAWEGTVAACLAKKPEDRPKTVLEVIERLQSPVAPAPAAASAKTAPKMTQAAPSAPQKSGAGKVIALLLVLAIGGGAGWWFLNQQPRSDKPSTDPQALTAAQSAAVQELFGTIDAAMLTRDQLKARDAFRRILEIDPTNARAKAGLALIEKSGGAAKVIVQPAGATVQIGTAPEKLANPEATFTSLPLGEAEVRVSKPGYATQTQKLEIRNDDTSNPLSIALVRETGSIDIGSNMSGTSFEVVQLKSAAGLADERIAADLSTGTAPRIVKDLPTGDYEVTFKLEGWAKQTSRISVTAGATVKANADYRKATLELTSTPPGVTLWGLPGSNNVTPFSGQVVPGVYPISIRQPGYIPQSFDLSLTPGDTVRQDIKLTMIKTTYTGTIREAGTKGEGTPVTFRIETVEPNSTMTGNMTQGSSVGDTKVKFSGSWDASGEMKCATGEVITKPARVKWDGETFSLSFSPDATTGTYRCTVGGKTFEAELTAK